MKITSEQQKDFIWCWKSNSRKDKVSLWIPYFLKAEKMSGKNIWQIHYNGGEIQVDLRKIDFLMFYGASGEISLQMLDEFNSNKIIFMIHRRNMNQPYIFYSSSSNDNKDILTNQILYRNNAIKKVYISRCLILARINSIKKDYNIYTEYTSKLNQAKTVDQIRNVEANISALFWKNYFQNLNKKYERRSKNNISKALDSGSHFLSGILLRWILFHKLSPNHAYLHVTTDFPSLIYDLIEPYRYFIENTVKDCVIRYGEEHEQFQALCIDNLKDYLEEEVYVPATMQYVARKNLLHGIVLSLRSYLLGETKRFVIPQEGEKKGGRPPKIAYRLPGEKYNRQKK